jgi:hypothetical protein
LFWKNVASGVNAKAEREETDGKIMRMGMGKVPRDKGELEGQVRGFIYCKRGRR